MGGAKNHAIVIPDADLDQVANELMGAGYGSAGERCMAISVVVPVTEKLAEALVGKLKPRVEALKIGRPTDEDAAYGPLITAAHRKKVLDYIDLGQKEGAELVVDGRGFKMQGYEKGFYLGASLFDRVTANMKTYQEEIFGPVLQIARARDFDEAVSLPSRHQYGNGVAIFTRDGDAAREFASRVNVGMVGINVPIPVPLAYYSFGGWKRSAFGDANQHGTDGVRFYTRLKTVTARWPKGARDTSFIMPTMR
jgi:malonate-semialdehyde dehydrogenase (acetylating)/methylmalonate-semialdehyde dehydrogenase